MSSRLGGITDVFAVGLLCGCPGGTMECNVMCVSSIAGGGECLPNMKFRELLPRKILRISLPMTQKSFKNFFVRVCSDDDFYLRLLFASMSHGNDNAPGGMIGIEKKCLVLSHNVKVACKSRMDHSDLPVRQRSE
ncbi:MAG: hypothetical protein LBV45_01720 [Xanthomonadaceae bacterium]|jgi:hypothetical protein|nr:hypothetical protein [Xanthomonadaceae bacterium]